MRNAMIAAATLLAGITLPATAMADDYRNKCRSNNGDQVVGVLVGGLLGGLIGSEIAGYHDRTEGAVIGAVVGGIAGAAITNGNDDCRPRQRQRYQQVRYDYNNGHAYDNRRSNNRYSSRHNRGSRHGYNRSYNRGYAGDKRSYRQEHRAQKRYQRQQRRADRNRQQRQYSNSNQRRNTYRNNVDYAPTSFVYLAGQNRPNDCRKVNRKVRDQYGYVKRIQTKECRTYGGQYRTWNGR
ncbi:MAG: glycine zipper 2TM domain-containing protein [Robiginitomaculum sp.]|nr:glycine zipper 2TM domain-containing protein [Robiginitomaculum sp.]